MDDPNRISFGGFTLNRERGCLENAAGSERSLRPKSYRVLEILCKRRDRLVSKDELVREVWPDLFVSDDSLAHCISDIRRALSPQGAKLLRTVPRRGYMLMGSELCPEFPHPARSNLRLILPAALGVALLVAVVGIWWTMPRSAVDSAPEMTDSALQQVQALLAARDWRRREDNERARQLLEKAVAEHPDDPHALAELGLTYWLEVQHLAWGGGRREMRRALDLVELSVALGESARSHRLLSEMRMLAPFPDLRSPVDALASARAAVAVGPDDPDNMVVLAQALALTGRSKEAVRMVEQALRLRPIPPDWYRQVAGLSYLLSGSPARAAEKLGPLYGSATFSNARWWPGWLFAASLAHAGRTQEAAAVVKAARGRRHEQSVSAVAQSFDGFTDEAGLALFLDGLRLAGMPG